MKRYFTVINLILIALLIHYGVKSIYKIAVSKLDVTVIATATGKQASPVENEVIRPMAYYQPIFERHLFGKEP